MDVQKNHVVVMSEDFEYYKIRPLKCSEGSKIFFSDDDIIRFSKGMRQLMAASVAAVLIIASLFGLYGEFVSPYSYAAVMTLDGGDSLELLLDKDKKVKDIISSSTSAYNMSKNDYLGLAVEHAVDAYAENSIRDSDENTMIVSVVPLKNKSAKQVESIKSAIYEQLLTDTDIESLNVVYVKSNSKNYNDAKKSGMNILEFELKESKASNALSISEYESLGFEVISKAKANDKSSKPINSTASGNSGKTIKNIPAFQNPNEGNNKDSSKSNAADKHSDSKNNNHKNSSSNSKANKSSNGDKK